jgi:hypothetical protein
MGVEMMRTTLQAACSLTLCVLAAVALALLAGCAHVPPPPPAIVIERTEPVPPPPECTIAGPSFPSLPEHTVPPAEAARDRAEIDRRYARLEALRAVCRAGLVGPQGVSKQEETAS